MEGCRVTWNCRYLEEWNKNGNSVMKGLKTRACFQTKTVELSPLAVYTCLQVNDQIHADGWQRDFGSEHSWQLSEAMNEFGERGTTRALAGEMML